MYIHTYKHIQTYMHTLIRTIRVSGRSSSSHGRVRATRIPSPYGTVGAGALFLFMLFGRHGLELEPADVPMVEGMQVITESINGAKENESRGCV